MPNAQEVLEWMEWDKERKANMTNEEYIRSCSSDELAGEIYEWYSAGYTTGRVGLPLNPITGIVEWLKEKHYA